MISLVLVFLLSALAAFFAGSLLNKEPPPTSDRGPTAVEETTQAPRTENKPERPERGKAEQDDRQRPRRVAVDPHVRGVAVADQEHVGAVDLARLREIFRYSRPLWD